MLGAMIYISEFQNKMAWKFGISVSSTPPGAEEFILTRGEHRFMKLMKLRKNGEHHAVFYFAKRIFFYIYDVITSPGKEKRSTYHYLQTYTHLRNTREATQRVCVCMCVCERERETQRVSLSIGVLLPSSKNYKKKLNFSCKTQLKLDQ